MSAANFEWAIRRQMELHAADFDRTVGPAPALETLVAAEPAPRRLDRVGGRLWLAVVGVGVLAFAAVLASLLMSGHPAGGPLSSVTPSATPVIASSSPAHLTTSPSSVAASTSPSGPAGPKVPGSAGPSTSPVDLGLIHSTVSSVRS
jgi:hypothetical protein